MTVSSYNKYITSPGRSSLIDYVISSVQPQKHRQTSNTDWHQQVIFTLFIHLYNNYEKYALNLKGSLKYMGETWGDEGKEKCDEMLYLFFFYLKWIFFSHKVPSLWFSIPLILPSPPHLPFHIDVLPFCLWKQTGLYGIMRI